MKFTVYIWIIAMLLGLTGCVTLYKPNVIHSPMLKEKGELKTDAAIALFGSGLYNMDVAYAVSNHMGLTLDGMYHYRKTTYSDGSGKEKFRIPFGQVGAGYFTSFGAENKGLFQCYGGFGYGGSLDKIYNSNTSLSNPEVSSKFFNVFIQPGIAYTTKNVEVAFDLRTNYVHVFDVHAYLYEEFEWWNTDSKYYNDTTFNFLNIEPTVTLKAGGRLKSIVQLGLTIPTVNPKSYFAVNNTTLLIGTFFKFSVGVNYTFGRKVNQSKTY